MTPRPLPALLALLLAGAGGCATTLDVTDMQSRVDTLSQRVERLERQAGAVPAAGSAVDQRISRVEGDQAELRRAFADLNALVARLRERMEAVDAHLQELDRNQGLLRKLGSESGRSLEELAARLEAELSSLSDKLKTFVEDR